MKNISVPKRRYKVLSSVPGILAAMMALVLTSGCELFEETNISELSNPINRVFKGRLTYAVGESPYEILVGDLNGDGLNDLVTLNWGAQTASVLLAKAGTFDAAVDYPVGASPRTGLLTDLDGNSMLDIAVVNETLDQITLLFGNGDGTFGEARGLTLPAGSRPYNIIAHDLDSDGFPDLVTANADSDSISVLVGDGNGEFLEPQTLPVGQQPTGLWAGQVRGDAVAEIVVANQASNALSVLEFDGINYVQTNLIPCGNGPRFVTASNLNGDAHLDLIVNNLNTGDLSILLGLGDGQFSMEMRYALPGPVARFEVADFTGDTIPDVVALLFTKTGEDRQPASLFSIASGDGTGGFINPATYGAGWRAIGLAVADMNGDTRLDVVTADLSRSTASVVYNRGNGTFESDRRFSLGALPGPAVLADFDQDEITDVAVANRDGNSISIMLGAGDGTFVAKNPLLLTASPQTMAAGDLNQDGRDDLVVYLKQQFVVWVYLSSGGGAFQAPSVYNLLEYNQGMAPQVMSMALEDMNSDTYLDIVAGNTKRDSVSVLLNNGTGKFENRVVTEVDNYPLAVDARDVNYDGKADLILVSASDPEVSTDGAEPRVARWFGNGDGSFDEESHLRFSTGAGPRAMKVADVSGNGRPDAVTVHTGSDSLYLLKGVSNTNFAPGTKLLIGENPVMVELVDVNRDGKNDLICALNVGGVVVRFSRGNMEFEAPNNFIVFPGIANLLVADLNKDQYSDLITINAAKGDMAVILGGPF